MEKATLEIVIALAEQLSAEERAALVRHLQADSLPSAPLTAEERKRRWQAAILHAEVNEVPSIRREDWYGDDGR